MVLNNLLLLNPSSIRWLETLRTLDRSKLESKLVGSKIYFCFSIAKKDIKLFFGYANKGLKILTLLFVNLNCS